ncbi:MAG: GTP-dependent dephospho-CoA kinase family protein [Methanobacteriota archaeon]
MSEKESLILPVSLRPSLQRPLGKLFPDLASAAEHIRRLNPVRLITVGDIVTYEFLSAGFNPDIVVVDTIAMRSHTSEKIKSIIESFDAKVVRVKNPAATITLKLRKALEAAKPPLKIIVDGEEDLATIPAVIESPDGSVVAYGQPKKGIVLVEVTEKKRREFQDILRKFKATD